MGIAYPGDLRYQRLPEHACARYFVGVVFLLFGVFKIALSVLSFSLSSATLAELKRVPVLSFFLPPDKTFAGLVFDGALCVFGVYSIFHGLSLMGVRVPGVPGVDRLVNDLFLSLALYLFVVYYIAVFTNVRFPEDRADRRDYFKTFSL